MGVNIRDPVSQQVWHYKDPYLLKGHNRSAKAYILQPFPAQMLTCSYKWKNVEWDVKQHTTNIPPIKLTIGCDISMFLYGCRRLFFFTSNKIICSFKTKNGRKPYLFPQKKFVIVFYAINIFNTIYYFKPTNLRREKAFCKFHTFFGFVYHVSCLPWFETKNNIRCIDAPEYAFTHRNLPESEKYIWQNIQDFDKEKAREGRQGNFKTSRMITVY